MENNQGVGKLLLICKYLKRLGLIYRLPELYESVFYAYQRAKLAKRVLI